MRIANYFRKGLRPAARAPLVFLLALAGLLLAACAGTTVYWAQPARSLAPLQLTAGKSAGQTFTARNAGLSGFDVYLAPGSPGGTLHFALSEAPGAPDPLAAAFLPVSAVEKPGYYRFSFPPLPSDQRDFYAELTLEGEGQVGVGRAAGGAYLDGALYRNGEPLDAQMAFRLAYDRGRVWQGYGRYALRALGILAAGALLFILPGWVLLGWAGLAPFNPLTSLAWGERLGLAAALSLALYPVLMLWTSLIGLRLGAFYAWLPVLGALAWAVYREVSGEPVSGVRVLGALAGAVYRRRGRAQLNPLTALGAWTGRWMKGEHFWPDLALLAVLLLVFATRAWAIRNLDMPLWGDSIQHTMITRLLVEHGGLFTSWMPYAELGTFTYHFGFHAAAAALHWLTGMDISQAVLWAGQLSNALAVLALVPLATRAGGSRWAGVGAALVGGLLLANPMAYTNWGRYTQLAGQVILPGVVGLSWLGVGRAAGECEGWRPGDRPWRALALGALAFGGLALTHYRVLVFGVLFVAVILGWELAHKRVRGPLMRAIWIGAGGGVLFAPWLLNVFSGTILRILANQLMMYPSSTSNPLTASPAQAGAPWEALNDIGPLTDFLPVWVWLLLPLALGAALWGRRRGAALVGLWWMLVVVAANPQWLGLPGQAALSNFAVFLAAYIPAGVILGIAVGMGLQAGPRFPWRGAASLGVVLVLGLAGARLRLSDVAAYPHTLLTRPDLRAMDWVEAHTPPDSRFLVNSFFAFGDTLIVGSDAGWWLPQLAGRQTSLPPINYATEAGLQPGYLAWVNGLARTVAESGPDSPEALQALATHGITHVYLGQRQGAVNYFGPPVLDPKMLLASSNYELLYHQDRVWVFAVKGP